MSLTTMASASAAFECGRATQRRPRYLFLIPSSSQMYSGTGTAAFDWVRYARGTYDFAFATDDAFSVNVAALQTFCARENLPLTVSRPAPLPGCPDTGISATPRLLADAPEVVECVSWANAATHLQLVESIRPQTRLVFTPHTQPLWTLGDPTRFPCVRKAFERTVERADLVLLDSRSELDLELFARCDVSRAVTVPLGVDVKRFRPHLATRPTLNTFITVCDFREFRKRADLLFQAFERAYACNRQIRLQLVGKGSDTIPVPKEIEAAVERRGYVSEEELIQCYRKAGTFVLLSDYEAFGLPIAESLACGLRAILNKQPAIVELFGGLSGVTLVDNRDLMEVAEALLSSASSIPDRQAIASDAVGRFAPDRTYGLKRRLVSQLLNASGRT